MRKTIIGLSALPLLVTLVAAPTVSALPQLSGTPVDFNVLARDGASLAQTEQAVKAAGGVVTERNDAVGLLTARAPENGFTERLSRDGTVLTAAKVQSIGQLPSAKKKKAKDNAIEQDRGNGNKTQNQAKTPVGLDPLDSQLWGLTSIHADLARDKTIGDKRVKVGIIDTGVDASHPDIAPNFDRKLSRNFTKDIPFDELGQEVDGPCEYRGCTDPNDVDNGGHGTHVAGTVAAAANGSGLSGVAPGVSIVNLRAGQDSGFFFLQPTVNALTYAADNGIDVVNMSFYVDPWLYNCDNNPADTPEQQAQQRMIKAAVSRALNYAHRKGVTLISAYGNEHTDSGNPNPDKGSPDFPANTAHERTIDNATCQSMPSEHPKVINVAAYGPSGKKSDFSTYGTEQISVSAPGGFRRDYFGTPWYNSFDNNILSTYPANVAVAEGFVDAAGNVTQKGIDNGVIKDKPGVYYRALQGTSMAAPHATGVAALIISTYGKFKNGDVSLDPDKVERVLEGTATATPCPTPRTVDYLKEGREADWTATCLGGLEFNGFFGHGQIDAYQAIVDGAKFLK
ncbi:S8 family serine peptidase [Kibdelosporangium philippinense]|uniref:S8 family serine peptidase n=1 Tax=Kibdelosporangium philippinense TaxID=211113 RepID=A0ABS8ZN81_9PSEU|nr:S8 family serine peptidase [Kibdelosporangium philippinense]MCE7008653.1 S8 family serine peptidase [Kibdelosporangium philippinense]